MTRTVVFFHAHPDDEALYTGGTMARLAAEGHRVVLVTATAGEAGLAGLAVASAETLGDLRRQELAASAAALGCARVVGLEYPDSGSAGHRSPAPNAFARIPVDMAAQRLSEVLREEHADALTVYDPAGGYGHPDHRQVHLVGYRASQLAATPVVLEATLDRRELQRALRIVGWTRWTSAALRPSRFDDLYSDPERITHCVDVGGYLGQKRAAMQAHFSQTTGGPTARTLNWFLRLPDPLFRLAFGREWFVERDRLPVSGRIGDVLASLG